jgi:hypothetical protein
VGLAPFFDRIYGAVGAHLSVSRESLARLLGKTAVGVDCSNAGDFNDEVTAELSTNLLARLYPRLCVTGSSGLASRLRQLAAEINPNIELVPAAPPEWTICVGNRGPAGALYPRGSGWVAVLDHKPGAPAGLDNPFAASAAASFAVAELFRRVFLGTGPEGDARVSLLDFGRDSGENAELDDYVAEQVLYAGVGAVGNAGLWVLGRHPHARGTMTVVDPEVLSLANLQRYVLGTTHDVGRAKVAIAKEHLGASALDITTYQCSLEEYADRVDGIAHATVVISVDNVPSRRAAQALLPRLVVNGWTGEASLGASWHRFDNGLACLACLYHPHGPGPSATDQAAAALGIPPERAAALWVSRQPLSDEDIEAAASALGVNSESLAPWRGRNLGDLYTDLVCGSAPIDLAGVGRLEVVPLAHQSVLAGVLMVTELVKRTDNGLQSKSQPATLVSWDDLRREIPSIWAKPRAREPGCICNDPDYSDVYRTKWHSGVG